MQNTVSELINIRIILPELILLCGACLGLMVSVFVKRPRQLTFYTVLISLAIAMIVLMTGFSEHSTVSFSGLIIMDPMAALMKLFVLLSVFAALIYSQEYITDTAMPNNEYNVLASFSTIGMLVLISSHSFLTVYLGLELLSLPLYAMVALRRDSAVASEAAMKYFVMGAIASGMLLYGMSMFYGATGHLDLGKVATAMSTLNEDTRLIFSFGLVFIVIGIGFKFAAVPFHMWAPDVYSGAPTSVTLFLSAAPKIAAFGMVTRLLFNAFPMLQEQWAPLMVVMAVLSMGIGNILAIAQTNIKRLLAYSAIAHMGYLFLGLLTGTEEGYSAALFYVLTYALMSLGAFAIIVLASKASYEIETIEDLKGLNQRNPWLAFMMLLFMFSMAGVPPTVGFLAKLQVLMAVIHIGKVWLAILAMFFSLIGAFYYIRIVKYMYFDDPVDSSQVLCSTDKTLMISLNGLVILWLGLFPQALIQLCQQVMAQHL